jgi:hypothetical protein
MFAIVRQRWYGEVMAKEATMNTGVTVRKNRKTETRVLAYEDEFLGWITVCETHGHYAEHRNKTTAISWLASPQTWCEKCGEVK